MVKKVCRSSTRGVISEGDVSQVPWECRWLDVLPGQAPKLAVQMENSLHVENFAALCLGAGSEDILQFSGEGLISKRQRSEARDAYL